MRTVLVLGFLWPYIQGSKRMIGLVQFLNEFGWEPVAVTPKLPCRPSLPFAIVETGYTGMLGRGVGRLGFRADADLGDQLKSRVSGFPRVLKTVLRSCFNEMKEIMAYPDEHKNWFRHGHAAGLGTFKERRIDAMISVWPVTSHIVARTLKKETGAAWLADLADLWSGNSAYPYSFIRKELDRRLERKTLTDADAVVTSSWPLAQRLSRTLNGRKIYDIMLGYDPGIVSDKAAMVSKDFLITYTGIFYPEKRNPTVFFEALKEWVRENDVIAHEVRVNLFGPPNAWVQDEIHRLGIGDIVKQCGTIPYDECVKRQKESQILLQINWNDESEKGVFSGKFLDYLAARRPILAAGGSGNDEVVLQILRDTRAGVYAPSKEAIKSALQNYYSEYKESGLVQYTGSQDKIDPYSNRHMAMKFAGLLDEMTQSSQTF